MPEGSNCPFISHVECSALIIGTTTLYSMSRGLGTHFDELLSAWSATIVMGMVAFARKGLVLVFALGWLVWLRTVLRCNRVGARCRRVRHRLPCLELQWLCQRMPKRRTAAAAGYSYVDACS